MNSIALRRFPSLERQSLGPARVTAEARCANKQVNRPFTILTTLAEPRRALPASSQLDRRDEAMGEVEVFLPNMRGSCVTVGKRVHGLFLFNGRPRQADPGRRSADIERHVIEGADNSGVL
jgi:hypothetical protein